MLDLDAYFARVGYSGPRQSTLAVLQALHALHPAAIPFENLDPLLGRPVALDLAALQDKLIHQRRGGYCFEHNTLFCAVLEQLGFQVTGLIARVLWRAPSDRPLAGRTHMLLKVPIDEQSYIADVGFGGLLADAALALTPHTEQAPGREKLRLSPTNLGFTLQAHLASEWHDVYTFSLEPQVTADYSVANWFTSAHPQSRFRNALMVERLLPDARISLANRKFTRRYLHGGVEHHQMQSAAELHRTLAEKFDLDPPGDLSSVFDRLPAS